MSKFINAKTGDVTFIDLPDDNVDAPPLSEDQLAAQVRAERNRLIAATDWRFRSDMTPSQAWIDYCQALRDIPEQPGFPHDVVWPEKP